MRNIQRVVDPEGQVFAPHCAGERRQNEAPLIIAAEPAIPVANSALTQFAVTGIAEMRKAMIRSSAGGGNKIEHTSSPQHAQLIDSAGMALRC